MASGWRLPTASPAKACVVVLADIETEPLALAAAALKEKGAEAIAVRTNVIHEDDIRALADAAYDRFGAVHVLCNNAGVAGGRPLNTPAWELSLQEWEWVFSVNFMGVLHGVRTFVPRMLEGGEEGHVVNTASMAGLTTASGPYHVSKNAVVCLTEGLYKDFKVRNAKLSASVLCPGWVNTNILESQRNRPDEYGAAVAPAELNERELRWNAAVHQFLQDGLPAEEVARQVYEAIRADQFYVIPAPPESFDAIRDRASRIVELRNPRVG